MKNRFFFLSLFLFCHLHSNDFAIWHRKSYHLRWRMSNFGNFLIVHEMKLVFHSTIANRLYQSHSFKMYQIDFANFHYTNALKAEEGDGFYVLKMNINYIHTDLVVNCVQCTVYRVHFPTIISNSIWDLLIIFSFTLASAKFIIFVKFS